jgi:hypothetical protein
VRGWVESKVGGGAQRVVCWQWLSKRCVKEGGGGTVCWGALGDCALGGVE